MNNVNYGVSSNPRTSVGAAAFNVGAKKNVVSDVGATESDSPDMPFLTQPMPKTTPPIRSGPTDTHYDEASSRPSIPMKSGEMQNI